MRTPPVLFADLDDVSIAYQAFGDRGRTVLGIPGFAQNIDLLWDEPHARRFFERFSSFARLVHFDKRGTGLSDRTLPHPSLEQRADEALAVMDAAGVDRAVLAGFSEGASLAAFLAATHPDRTEGLILAGGTASYVRRDDHPWAPTLDEAQQQFELVASVWGQGTITTDFFAPSMASNDTFRAWAARYELQAINPSRIREFSDYMTTLDIREVLPAIRVPTVVFHATGDRIISVESARYLADHIDQARFVEVDGDDHAIWYGNQDAWLATTAEFLTGEPPTPEATRVLATVLFSDIVESTSRAHEHGDASWRTILDHHDRLGADVVRANAGRVVKSTGDGLLATFDIPSRGVAAALALVERVREELGLEIRVGLHCGEVETRGDDLAGIAVHQAARIEALAPPGGVTVSRTVKDLVAGSRLEFADRGPHGLKGIESAVELFDVLPNVSG